MVMDTVNSKRRLIKILAVIMMTALLLSARGLLELILAKDFVFYRVAGRPTDRPSRVMSLFHNPNSFGAWLIVVIPVLLTGMLSMPRHIRKMADRYRRFAVIPWAALLSLTAVLLLCLILTYSRGAWIALFFAIVFLCLFWRKQMLMIAALCLLIIFSASIPKGFIRDRMTSITSFASETNRAVLWQEAAGIISEYPLTGCGFNNYTLVGPNHKLEGGGGYYPHNSYLHLAAETGLIGLGAFLWIIFVLFRNSLSNLRNINDEFYNSVLAGLLAGLFGFLAQSFVDTNLYAFRLAVLMWFVMGLVIAVQKIALSRN
jgi:putative inorganic carbon (HCO3(-)) transporter